MVQTWRELCNIGSHVARLLQARAHTLLRQKELELSRARESAAQQFHADVTAAEAATQRTQHLLEQVGQIAHVGMRLLCVLQQLCYFRQGFHAVSQATILSIQCCDSVP